MGKGTVRALGDSWTGLVIVRPGRGGTARSENWTEARKEMGREEKKGPKRRWDVPGAARERLARPPPPRMRGHSKGPGGEKPRAAVITCVGAAAARRGLQGAPRSCCSPPAQPTPGHSPSLSAPSLATPSSQPLPHHGPTLPTPTAEPLPGRRKNHRVPRNGLERPRVAEPRPDQPEGPGSSSQAGFSRDR